MVVVQGSSGQPFAWSRNLPTAKRTWTPPPSASSEATAPQTPQSLLLPGTGLANVLRTLPMFHDEAYAQACGLPEDTLVLPPTHANQGVIYTVLECQPLFDSSDMTITEWVQIAQTIETHDEQFHGFVVLHGTDPMAFVASALAFVLENLQKTAILAGSQVPIHALWSDGRENLLGALLMAGQYVIPEVCLFFQNQLFRGTRVTKVDTRRFAAFRSPNLPPLAVVGADVISKLRGPGPHGGTRGSRRSVVPGRLHRAEVARTLDSTALGFGPSCSPPEGRGHGDLRLWEWAHQARPAAGAERGLIILNCTHCLQGSVTSHYAAGMAAAGAGIVSGFDMTSEAALAKLSYVLGRPGLSVDGRKELLARDLRGEMTLPAVDEGPPPLCGSTLRLGVAQFLSLSQESDAVRDTLTPSLACAAARAGDLEALQALAELWGHVLASLQGTDLSLEDFNGQTPLHAAARGGHAGVVAMLLQKGVNVDARDEDGLSPLLLAVRGRRRGVIGLLRAAGACLSPQELEEAGTELCRLASRADGEGLQARWQAGADLGRPGYDGRSALLVAEAAGNLEVMRQLQYLQGGAGGLALMGLPGRADHASEELPALRLDPGLGDASKGQA
ncbi:60 kDa lysophospholipase [Pteropus alecto]|uniref:asparaginase n=1 Tax=Pteropus alecto TaxID=9402 RepID=L5JR45_PTEAL|nr:60 kDa lysophospholipase [Pteropus alecto]